MARLIRNGEPSSWRAAGLVMGCVVAAVILMPRGVVAQQPVAISVGGNIAAAAAIEAYWTPERMQKAIPRDVRAVAPAPGTEVPAILEKRSFPDFVPGYAPGSPPGGGGAAGQAMTVPDAAMQTSPPFSPPSSPTDVGNYAPFQRWTWISNYLLYPISTIGKLFFTLGAGDFVCSASVVHRNTIATAGHCVADGNGNGASNFLFCPSYFRGTGSGSPHPSLGCWGGVLAFTSGNWFVNGAVDRDYACIVTSPSNSTTGSPVGNVTGWTGRAWNFPSRQATFSLGYPAAPPFPGYHIIAVVSTEWYEQDMYASDGQVSKYIGNDMTGGSSGGPWWLNMVHPNNAFEYPDTDGSSLTDPAQGNCCPWINGVNSHKRCNQAGCPPGSVFTQEMGSPQFDNTAADGDESEDVFADCFNNGGS
jgi:V8-like Glu-specific endopeptidase